MKFQKRSAVAGIVMLASAVAANADSGLGKSSTVFKLTALVPVICHVELEVASSSPNDNGVAPLGTAKEFCNAPRGYRVLVEHAADLPEAAIVQDGVRIPLSPTGTTVLTDSSHPDISKRTLAIEVGNNVERFRSLAVRIEPKG